MYIYKGHLDSLYSSDEILDYEDLYCEECGDSDYLIGNADSRENAWKLLEDETDINGSGGWDYGMVAEFIKSNWEESEKEKEKRQKWCNQCHCCNECKEKETFLWDKDRKSCSCYA